MRKKRPTPTQGLSVRCNQLLQYSKLKMSFAESTPSQKDPRDPFYAEQASKKEALSSSDASLTSDFVPKSSKESLGMDLGLDNFTGFANSSMVKHAPENFGELLYELESLHEGCMKQSHTTLKLYDKVVIAQTEVSSRPTSALHG